MQNTGWLKSNLAIEIAINDILTLLQNFKSKQLYYAKKHNMGLQVFRSLLMV